MEAPPAEPQITWLECEAYDERVHEFLRPPDPATPGYPFHSFRFVIFDLSDGKGVVASGSNPPV